MDRQIVYPGAIPQDLDLLLTNKNVMVGLGYLIQAILGGSTVADGLACTATTPASLSVKVATGAIYSLQNIDNSAYGSVAADTNDAIMKQGIALGTTTFSCPPPSSSGQSINYLIQAQYQDVDAGAGVLPYYDASNPSVPYSGPSNSGTAQNTVRKGVCVLSLKAGTAATTGSQTTPAPDAGYTGLYSVSVANGQTTITSSSITQLASASFVTPKLPAIIPAVQSGAANYAADSSGAANTIAVALTPAPAGLTAGMPLRVKVANANTGAVVINVNGLGNVSAVQEDGSAIPAGALQANGVYTFVYDGTKWQWQTTTGAHSLSASGYQILPSGLIIQWGSDIVTLATTFQNFSLPLTYPNAHLTCVGSSGSVNSYAGAQVGNNSLIGLFASNAGAAVNWISIGY